MYPILIRLADRGLLETSWETDRVPGRPARHLYRLTSAGRAYASSAAAAAAATTAVPTTTVPTTTVPTTTVPTAAPTTAARRSRPRLEGV
jgi:hypothetical protein